MNLIVDRPEETRRLLDSDPTYVLRLMVGNGRDLLEAIEQGAEVDAADVHLVVQARTGGEFNLNPVESILLPTLHGAVAVTGGEGFLQIFAEGEPLLAIDSSGGLPSDRSVQHLVVLGATGAHAETSRELTSLTRLDLLDCGEGIEAVLEAIRGLPHLRHLNVRRSDSFRDLKPFRNLAELKSLSLNGCEGITDLEPLTRLTGLTSLDLSSCAGLTNLEPLAGLTGLTRLKLWGCETSLKPLAKVTGLTSLDLSSCAGLTSLEPLAGLTALRSLNLSGCKGLTSLEPLAKVTGLTNLNLYACEGLTSLEPLAGLSGLTSLDLSYCNGVTSLEPLTGLKELTDLSLSQCEALASLEPLAELTGLRSLDLSAPMYSLAEYRGVTGLEPLTGLKGLTSLNLSGCKGVTNLEPLTGLTGLTNLDLSGCEGVTNLDPLAGLTGLRSLDLSPPILSGAAYTGVRSLEPLAGLTGLATLKLPWCEGVRSLEPLAGLTGLTGLELPEYKEVSSLKPLMGLTRLRSLDLSSYEKVTSLEPLAALTGLRSLNLSGCKGVTSLEPLAGLTGLTSLSLDDCEGLTSLEPLAGLTGLTSLSLDDCEGLTSLEPLSGLTMLRSLGLCAPRHLHPEVEWVTNLEPLAGLTRLRSLDLSGPLYSPPKYRGVTSLEPLAGLMELMRLKLSRCKGVTSLEPLAGLAGLTELDLSECEGITSLEPLANLTELTSLDLKRCSSIRELKSLEACHSLESLEFDIHPPEATAILLSSAMHRGESQSIQAKLPEALEQVQRARDIPYYSLTLARAFRSFPHESWAIDAMGELVRRVRSRGDLDQNGWRPVLANVVALGDPGMRAPMASLIEDLSPHECRVLLPPWLEALSTAPESARDWAVDLVDQTLLPWQETPHAAEISASAALFYARMGRDLDVSNWLERATQVGEARWRDRVNLALLEVDLERMEFEQARRRVDSLVAAPARDDGLARYAGALADSLPQESGMVLEEVTDSLLRKHTATDLAKRESFAALPENAVRLLLILQEDAGALATLLSRLTETHPESAVVREFLRQADPVEPVGPDGPPLESLLEDADLVNFLGTSRTRRVREALFAAPPTNRTLLLQGLVTELGRRGLLDGEEGEELLDTISPRRATGDRS